METFLIDRHVVHKAEVEAAALELVDLLMVETTLKRPQKTGL